MTLLIAVTAGLALSSVGVWRAARSWWKLHGKRIVACPESGQPAAVDLAMGRAALTGAFRRPSLQLRDCSRWPERGRCSQPCLRQIEAAPDDSLVLTIVSKWYGDKTCACCGRSFEGFPWVHQPCVMSPGLHLVEWKDVPAEDVPRILATHLPVCWTCLIAETHIT